jgi:CheY-like chemotaxis protein
VKTRILIVEDNEMNRDVLSRRLARSGYEVLAACDGVEGVAKVIAERPDLVIMDLSLPELDGWDAARQLKARADTANIPILALSAHAMDGDRERALAAGCDDYDTKPIEITRLLNKIIALLTER